MAGASAGLSREAHDILRAYDWPGNVRQLRNALERAAILCEGGLITGEHLSLPDRRGAQTARTTLATAAPVPLPDPPSPAAPAQADDLATLERTAIERALRETRFNKSEAARRLGLTRTQLYVRLKKYGLD